MACRIGELGGRVGKWDFMREIFPAFVASTSWFVKASSAAMARLPWADKLRAEVIESLRDVG